MRASSQWIRRAFLWSAAGATTAVMVVAGSSAEAAHLIANASPAHSHPIVNADQPGYRRPGGIYKPFTICPLLNPLMQESVNGSAMGCIAADTRTGSIKIGTITTPITHPVVVQFGIWDPPNATPSQFTGGILPPRAGLSAQLVGGPDRVPGGLLKALGCPSSRAAVERLCREAKHRGGRYLRVYSMAQSAGPITNFALTTWTQPLKLRLINPLLGSYCYIGSNDNPIVINPSVTGTLVVEKDPHPKLHPDTDVLKVTHAVATDTAFTAPGVTGCGPGGSANIAIDKAIDTSTSLPSASGNSITLNGTFYFAACYAPKNMAKILLSAFRASAGVRPASENAGSRITIARLRSGHYGIR
jgi:hypothetical protein